VQFHGFTRETQSLAICGLDAPKQTLWDAPTTILSASEGGRPVCSPGVDLLRFSAKGRRFAVLGARHVFDRLTLRALEKNRPDQIVILTHQGTTERWHPRLRKLRDIATTFVVWPGRCQILYPGAVAYV